MTKGLRVTLCINALRNELGGIGRYTWELAKHLPSQDSIASVRYFTANRLIPDPEQVLNGKVIYPGRGLRRVMRAQTARRALRSTLVHAPNYFLPQAANRGIVTVHDLSVFRYPETHPLERVKQFERFFEDSLKRADQIITDTETVRRELIETFNVQPKRVTAVALGVSDQFRPIGHEEIAVTLSGWGLNRAGYGLCVSALEPRKNVSELITAWRRLPQTIRDRFPLVLAGGTGWMNGKIHEQLKSAAAEGWLRHLGHVNEADLARLYAGAALFVYPSAYEGFGLPPIEAMASGVPVIVSNRSCLPEVCGDAARYIDPYDIDGMTISIEESLLDSTWRSAAIQRGLERAAQFTWKRCIEETVEVYSGVKGD